MKWINARKKLPTPWIRVLCIDILDNEFIGYVDQNGNWFVDVYGYMDKPIEAGVAEYWCEIKSPYSRIYHRILRAWRKMRRKK